MIHFTEHLAKADTDLRAALAAMNGLGLDPILFVVDHNEHLLGSMTDGDVRRGLLNGRDMASKVTEVMNPAPKFLRKGDYRLSDVIAFRERNINVIPVVDRDHRVLNVLNLRHQRSYLPVDALIMAGGRGERLRPLTDDLPKPLLPVGGKAIIEHNLDRLRKFGIDDIWISVKYLGHKIESHFGDGTDRSLRIAYVQEEEPLGTAGALGLAQGMEHSTVLMMNSDLLTNIDFEELYVFFEKEQADLAVACIPYHVNVPYAIMETVGHTVTDFKEKPTYTYYANAGIYLMRKEVLRHVPKGRPYNATDLMKDIIGGGGKVVSFPFMGYWLDIGRHEDYRRADEEFNQIKF